MNQLLNDPNVQAAIVALLVVLFNALAQWVRSKVSYAKLVDDNWCYIQPLRDWAINEAQASLKAGTWGNAVGREIAIKTLAKLADVYRVNEDKEPSATLLAAVSDEIEKAILKVVEK